MDAEVVAVLLELDGIFTNKSRRSEQHWRISSVEKMSINMRGLRLCSHQMWRRLLPLLSGAWTWAGLNFLVTAVSHCCILANWQQHTAANYMTHHHTRAPVTLIALITLIYVYYVDYINYTKPGFCSFPGMGLSRCCSCACCLTGKILIIPNKFYELSFYYGHCEKQSRVCSSKIFILIPMILIKEPPKRYLIT